MSKFYNFLTNNKIYESEELSKFIMELEQKYNIINDFEHYNQLVNFSQNKDKPVHEWFKYREGFSSTLIEEIINISNLTSNDIILDPFVGSGTTSVVATQMGYESIGIDVNPMSIEVAKIKSTKYTDSEIKQVKKYLDLLKDDYKNITINENELISKYFQFDNYIALKKIMYFINKLDESKVKEILFCSYLSIIEECSDRKRDGNGLKTVPTKVRNVLNFYLEKTNTIINDILTINKDYKATSHNYVGTAKDLNKYVDEIKNNTNKQIGAIIFSPPYANSFDYFESYKLELNLGGFITNKRTINTFRNNAIRSFIGCEHEDKPDKYIRLLSKEIEDAIPIKEKETGKKDARTRKVPQMIMGYFKDMEKVIEECYKALRKNGKCYIVIDQNSYLGKIIPSDLLFAYFAEKHGFKVNEIIECRTAKTSSQQQKKYPYLKEMLRESIVVLEK